ncbi:beta-2-microglobulin-like [Xiphias gladius]|uniref:beta-2-microglobulin-like n=1 Tax=Xiphias gladius TaxID=8245 RepID=UPI001A983B6D|nr:beta-2-microglobulin-like [Xiphias gladius]
MKAALYAFVIGLFCLPGPSATKEYPPTVQVYSRRPAEYGKDNVLMCYVTGFHPPLITIDLLKNGNNITEAIQSDLSFEEGWFYTLLKHGRFTPSKGDQYACRVTHMGRPKTFFLESDN